jgi:hypothetical protein
VLLEDEENMRNTTLRMGRGGAPLLGSAGRRPAWLVALVAAALLLAAFLLAALVGLGAWQQAFGMVALTGFGALISFGLLHPSQKTWTAIVGLVLVVTLAHPVLDGVARLPIGYVYEVLCFGLLFGCAASAWRMHGRHPAFQWLVMLALLFFAAGLISSVAGRSKPLAAIWQAQYNLKLPAMLLIGMALAYTPAQERVFKAFVALAWIPIAGTVLLEMVAPGVYMAVFKQPIDHTINPLIGMGVRRQGLFPHSGYLALTAAMLGWASCVWAVEQRRWRWLLPLGGYLTLLLLAGQRQETAALVMAMAVMAAFHLRRHWQVLSIAGTLLAGLLVVLMLVFQVGLGEKLRNEWGAGQKLERVSERYVLTQNGFQIADENFPVGSGLGTYGGAGAQKFDQSQFYDRGFDRYWWFRQGQFLVDVYWPSVAAESGYLGAACWASAMALVMVLLVRQVWRTRGTSSLAWIASGAIILLLGNSPTSAALTDPRIAFWMWLLIGAALSKSLGLKPLPK